MPKGDCYKVVLELPTELPTLSEEDIHHFLDAIEKAIKTSHCGPWHYNPDKCKMKEKNR